MPNEKRYIKEYDKWNEVKKEINLRKLDANFYVLEGEIWWTSIGLNVGHEIDGKNIDYRRPVLILRKFSEDPQWVLPITSRVIRDGGYLHKIHGSRIHGYIPIQQFRSISSNRLLKLAGRLDVQQVDMIRKQLTHILIKSNPP